MTEQMLMKQPASDSTERAVLGCIFIDHDAMNIVAQQLHVDDFYNPKNQAVYEAMLRLSAKQDPIDYQTVEAQLRFDGLFDEIGGIDYLLLINEGTFYQSNLEAYIGIVKEKSLLRKLISIGNDTIRKAFDGTNKASGILEGLEEKLLKINQNQLNSGLTLIKDTLPLTLDRISNLSANKGQLTGLSTGFRNIDMQISGLQKSDLILIAARPSMGKTALGVNMGYNVARYKNSDDKYPNKVAVFSLEMSKLQLNQRLLAMASGMNLQDIISGNIENQDDWDRLLKGFYLLNEIPMYIDDTSSISIQELRSKCRRMKMEHGLDLIVIDYLQLMTVEDKKSGENRQQEISAISRGLKGLAKEMECPVIALSQLSRKAESREGARPMMSDMRESGAIEQDADIVMLLYREDYYNKETENQNITEVNIAKHRNGPTGVVKLFFKKEQTKFGDMNYVEDPSAQ